MQKDGKRHLALLLRSACDFLKNIEDIGAMYANLRTENVIIMFDGPAKNDIVGIKFLNLGHMISIEDSEYLRPPE